LLTIVGTFLTRSGVVQSVHAFGSDPVLAWTFGGFMLLIVVVSFGLLVWRLPLLRSRGELESVMSREFAFLVNNWLFLVCALFVLGATMWPTFTEWRMILAETLPGPARLAGPGRARVDRAAVLQPVHAAARAVAAAADRGRAAAGVAQDLHAQPGPVSSARAAAGRGGRDDRAVRARASSRRGVWRASACAASLLDDRAGVLPRGRAAPEAAAAGDRRGDDLAGAAGAAALRRLHRAPGDRADVLGWAGNAYKVERKTTLRPGETFALGEYVIRHDGLRATEDWQKEMITADIAVLKDGVLKDTLRPARWWYYQLPEQPTTEVSRYMTAGEDVYVSMQEVDMTTGWTQLSLFVNPLINWIWIGFAVMLAGSLVCVGTRKSEAGEDV
jgi:cytochrome c-type biogenesis protein CcmF